MTDTPGASTSSAHLSFPKHTPRLPTPPAQEKRDPQHHPNRLYVGNLHPSVDEYSFLQVFSKYGKVSKLDYLFHKSGPHKGRPRGYAFVEYLDKDDANRALVGAHDKLLRGRKLVVTFAHQAPPEDGNQKSHKRRPAEVSRPTALSLMKTTPRSGKTEDKIAALEAKLNQMQQVTAPSDAPPSLHPSLPKKPPPQSSPNTQGNDTPPSRPTKPKSQPGDPVSSTPSTGIGKKPTLQELMKANTHRAGLLKR